MRIAIPATLIFVGLVGLITAGVIVGGIPELQVAQLLESEYDGKRTLKVHGILAEIESEDRPLKFTVSDKADPTKRVVVECDRTKPDTFQTTYDIAIQGTWDAERGVFVADQIFTKCPSKYEAEDRYKAGTEGADGEAKPIDGAPSEAVAPVEDAEKGVE